VLTALPVIFQPSLSDAQLSGQLLIERKEPRERVPPVEATQTDADELGEDEIDSCFDQDLDIPIWDCVMGSSAAPTYFPSYKRQIDAAVMCNNPALAAISVLMSEKVEAPKTPQQIHILSLGTGRLSQFIDGDAHDWGMIRWTPYLLQIMIGATSLYEQKQAQYILGPRYHRVDPFLSSPLAMDDPLLLPILIDVALKVDLEETIEWIEENWYTEEEGSVRRAQRESEQKKQTEISANSKEGPSQGVATATKPKTSQKQRRGTKGHRMSVYAPVGEAGEGPALRGTWGDAAWFGS